MRLVFILCIAAGVAGCLSQVYTGAKVAKTVGCAATTEEGRAEIREKQKLKTNVCGDKL